MEIKKHRAQLKDYPNFTQILSIGLTNVEKVINGEVFKKFLPSNNELKVADLKKEYIKRLNY